MNDYIDNQHRLWSGLVGLDVTGWSGPRWPFDWDDDDDESFTASGVWSHPDATFDQLYNLAIYTKNAKYLVNIGQEDATFFLQITADAEDRRRRGLPAADLSGFPSGTIEDVSCVGIIEEHSRADGTVWRREDFEPQIIEVLLTIEGRQVALVAGAHQPRGDDALHMIWSDESVLVFERAADVETVNWLGERSRRIAIPVMKK